MSLSLIDASLLREAEGKMFHLRLFEIAARILLLLLFELEVFVTWFSGFFCLLFESLLVRLDVVLPLTD